MVFTAIYSVAVGGNCCSNMHKVMRQLVEEKDKAELMVLTGIYVLSHLYY
jgi:hypothetical protein